MMHTKTNDAFIVSKAARMCYGLKPYTDLEDQLKHVERVLSRGHESILEHSNALISIKYQDITELVPYMKFLEVSCFPQKNTRLILISGSIRAFLHFFEGCLSNNIKHKSMSEIMNSYLPYVHPIFFCNASDELKKLRALYDYNSTMDYKYTENKMSKFNVYKTQPSPNDVIYDPNYKMPIDHICADMLGKHLKCTFEFHNISRPISMQINRHRNAISQESQRYVNYSNKGFVDPLQFIGRQDQVLEFKDPFDPKKKIKMTSKHLGETLIHIYQDLVNKPNELNKQDARSFLPSNVVTNELVTFTYDNLESFIYLRDSKAAQPEIHALARDMSDIIDLLMG